MPRLYLYYLNTNNLEFSKTNDDKLLNKKKKNEKLNYFDQNELVSAEVWISTSQLLGAGANWVAF